mmetsp:Transcript_19253/g.64518  ORF Transcript_19253/g.64518 Transcript_19253/m.64518 type:complete len:328 (+) Transcript_19253:247-1230(+)
MQSVAVRWDGGGKADACAARCGGGEDGGVEWRGASARSARHLRRVCEESHDAEAHEHGEEREERHADRVLERGGRDVLKIRLGRAADGHEPEAHGLVDLGDPEEHGADTEDDADYRGAQVLGVLAVHGVHRGGRDDDLAAEGREDEHVARRGLPHAVDEVRDGSLAVRYVDDADGDVHDGDDGHNHLEVGAKHAAPEWAAREAGRLERVHGQVGGDAADDGLDGADEHGGEKHGRSADDVRGGPHVGYAADEDRGGHEEEDGPGEAHPEAKHDTHADGEDGRADELEDGGDDDGLGAGGCARDLGDGHVDGGGGHWCREESWWAARV